jgi:diguanylate cyclase (GGDEF)-like protein
LQTTKIGAKKNCPNQHIYFLMRLTRLFMLTTGILLMLVLVMLSRSMLQDWRTVQSAQQGLQAMELAYKAMKVAEKASAERGPTIPVLNDTVPPDPAKRARLDKAREASDAAIAEALAGLAETRGSTYESATRQLRKTKDELALARQEIERVAALPFDQRVAPGARLTRKPIDQMFAVIDTALEGVTVLSAEAERIYPDLSLPLVGARFSAELREYAGRLGSQFTAPLATQTPLGSDERRDIPLLIGRIEQLRKLIEVQARTHLTDVRVTDAIAEMNKRYFGVGLPFIGELTAAGISGQPYGVESATFVARYVPEMASIVQLRDKMFEVSREGAASAINTARNRMVVNALIGLAIFLVEILVLVLIQRRVLRPLLVNTQSMKTILSGNLDVPIVKSTRLDEIGDMEKAVAALQETSQRTKNLEQEREQLITQLLYASNVDFLTNLPNRRAFTEQTAQHLADAKTRDLEVAQILFDIDYFKSVNDRFGHAVGDAVLVRLAQLIQTLFRDGDVIARYGGEEFIAMAFGCSAVDALALAERVRSVIEVTEFQALDGKIFHVTASFGVATARARNVETAQSLFRPVDQALYRAKSEGRNRVVALALDSNVLQPSE